MASMSFTEKMGLAAGSASLALVPGAASAGLVTVTPAAGTVKISFADPHDTIVSWDVDSTGNDEFHLKVFKNQHIGFGYKYGLSIIELNSHDNGSQLNGRGFVGVSRVVQYYGNTYTYPDEKVRVLNSSFDVGQTLASPYIFGVSNVDNERKLMERGTYNSAVTQNGGEDVHTSGGGLAGSGNFFIGFRFDPGDGIHYGWAEMNLDFVNDSVEILRWTYNDVAGEAVHVGTEYTPEVPVPASIIPALTMLGMGAAGLRLMRKRREREEAA